MLYTRLAGYSRRLAQEERDLREKGTDGEASLFYLRSCMLTI
jgi:hypothetical protein